MSTYRTGRILPIIVLSQFLCTSLWFAGNAVLPDLVPAFGLNQHALGHVTSAIQFGFISGTFIFAFLTIADRFPPSRVFFLSSIAAAAANLAILVVAQGLPALLIFRFLTGFFLAGIYPVGMKIASDYYDKGLGKALGFLVGALVVGTAFPHLLRSLTLNLSWQLVLSITSALSVTGGLFMLLLIPDGPYRKMSQKADVTALFKVFGAKPFRRATFGYFGHMWELYTFWAFVPVILGTYLKIHPEARFNVPALSFLIIGLGGLSCVGSGYVSQQLGPRKTAFLCLFCSGICCLLSPLAFLLPPGFFLAFLIFWGLAVIADSPMFSTLVAQLAMPRAKGTALTVVTCIGFAITIASIELLSYLSGKMDGRYLYLLLAIGPVLGLKAIYKPLEKPNLPQPAGP